MTATEGFDDRAEAAAEVRAEWVRQRTARWQARIPRRYRLDWPMDDEVATWAALLVSAKPGDAVPTLWLAGNVGSGKTGNVWHLGLRLYQAGWSGGIEVVTGADLFELAAPPTDYAALRRMAAADLLVVDDADAAEATPWFRQHLYSVFNERWQEARPTVLTSNEGDLGAKVGDRVASRLQPVQKVLFGGPDYRRQP